MSDLDNEQKFYITDTSKSQDTIQFWMLITKFQNFMERKFHLVENVMDNIDMFQAIFGKLYEFGW